MRVRPRRLREVVLVGGGHAHVQVLRRFMMRPPADAHLTLLVDRPEALYSGMVPGFVAGDYRAAELEIDVVPLARRARAALVLAPAVGIDASHKEIAVEGRPPLRYDLASLDVGSTVAGLDLPGVLEHALCTRPIRRFVDELTRRLERLPPAGGEICIVGAGAAGLELAFTLQARLARSGERPGISLLYEGDVLQGYPARVRRRAQALAEARGIRLHPHVSVTSVEKDAVWAGEQRFSCDLAVLATGAAPLPLFAESDLPRDAAGFVRVRDTLQVVGHDALYAVGDCAAVEGQPWIRKAGVYAVREGPVLERNLRAALAGGAPRRFRAQRDFLSLIHLGGGRALAAKWGLMQEGRAAWALKDRIDRRFMRRFQVLGPDARLSPDFPTPESMGMEPMVCGGCAAKVGASALEAALGRLAPAPADPSVELGLDRPDDAALLSYASGDRVLATVDGFRAFTDDPYLVGRVSAVNALSDVVAKGGCARHALALVTVPEERDPEETLFQVLAGVRAALDESGVSLVGGHSTLGPELFVALTITGDLGAGREPLPLAGLREGDVLVLTKPLGSGVVLAADMQGRAPGGWLAATLRHLQRSNARASELAREAGAIACTDVSGFGIARHLGELLAAGGVAAELEISALPALPGALELLECGVRSTFHEQNRLAAPDVAAGAELRAEPAFELLFDPQTSGGLLFGLRPGRVPAALSALREAGDREVCAIGRVVAADGRTAPLRLRADRAEGSR